MIQPPIGSLYIWGQAIFCDFFIRNYRMTWANYHLHIRNLLKKTTQRRKKKKQQKEKRKKACAGIQYSIDCPSISSSCSYCLGVDHPKGWNTIFVHMAPLILHNSLQSHIIKSFKNKSLKLVLCILSTLIFLPSTF